MNIIGYRKIFFFFSGIMVLASLGAILFFGFRIGADFQGGALWQIRLSQTNAEEIKTFLQQEGLKNVSVFPVSDNSLLIKLDNLSETEHQKYLKSLQGKFGNVEELRFESIGPSVGNELKNKAIWAVVLVLIGISLFVAYAFRKVSHPVKSWKYGFITLITLFHDVIVPAGLIAFLGNTLGVEADINFVVALLVVMGFSVHDTIVVFDRIRENLMVRRAQESFESIVNNSVNQTLARSINTSLTLILVLISLFFFGPITLKYFILTILTGTIVGAYSSIFIASPLLVTMK